MKLSRKSALRIMGAAGLISLSACMTSPPDVVLSEPIAAQPMASPVPWLVGCWVSPDSNSRGEWRAAGESLMFGYGVTSRDGVPVFFEQERIEARNGGMAYFAYPLGKGPTRFVMTAQEPDSVTFEAPEHDHPQRIVYSRVETGIEAAISNLDGSRPGTFIYHPCEA